MKARSWQLAITLGGIGLLGSFTLWAITNNAVSACATWVGIIAQGVDNTTANQCETASVVHILGIAGMAISFLAVIIGFIGIYKSSS